MKHRIQRIHRRRLTEATDFKAIERLVKSTIDNIVADIENDGFIMDTKDGKRVRVQGLKKHEIPRAQEQFEELVVDALQSQEPNFYGWDVYQDEIEAGWQKLVDLSNGRYASEDDFTTSRIANTLDNLLPMNVQLREEDFIEAGYDNPEDWEDERVLEYVLAKSYGYYPTAVDNVVNTNNGIVSVNGIEWDRSRPFVNEDEEDEDVEDDTI